MNLENKVMVITGATGGVGLAIARVAARKGATLVICGRHADTVEKTVAALQESGVKASGIRADVANPEDLARWLYENQSGQGRFHAASRLFVVLCDTLEPDRTWELRRDFERLQETIHAFLSAPRLLRVAVADGAGGVHRPLTGVVFCARERAVV